MSCCSEQVFERHEDPAIADIGSGGGAEFTVGRCKSCGALLMHCWVGSVMHPGGYEVVSQALIDRFLAEDPSSRKVMLGDWFNSLT